MLYSHSAFEYNSVEPVNVITPNSSKSAQFDVVIRGGTIFDGSGAPRYTADLGINNDLIAAIGDLKSTRGGIEIDATGLAVAPGFINMLSWATETLIYDGRSRSDIYQGVTLEVVGEGTSMGPLNEEMKRDRLARQGDIKYAIEWTTLGEYLEFLTRRGISPNIASFVGATSLRIHEIGHADRPPTTAELDRMRGLVGQAMEEGAVGLSSALIYAPACYAKTDELIELCKVVAEYGGIYISHLRSESNRLLEAADEFLTIAREANIAAEIYHLKVAGSSNWHKLDPLIAKIEAARVEGLRITADMYTYTAAQTGLDAMMPPWVQEGGHNAWVQRLRDPAVRARLRQEITTPSDNWENFYTAAGSADRIMLVGFNSPGLKPFTGKTLAEMAQIRGKSPEETAMDLVVEDNSEINAVYFLMSEENVRKQLQLPWVSFGSDAASRAPEGLFLKSSTHPRTYGNFVRVIGKYSRDEKLISLEQAIRRLSSLPAENLKLDRRGVLKPGYFADVVVFDPETVRDTATYEKPHQLATGMLHVIVNGVQVLKDGEHTGAKPGRVIRGPGWKGRNSR